MSRPRTIEIDGRVHLWADIVEARRQQLAAYRRAVQPALFELALDRRPETQRSAAGRYAEPLLFEARI